jgi:hypothetical protein
LEGDNVTWIPGYWAWDDERSDFLWVSGVWRNLPPGRQWVPGYWGRSDMDYQWISGYWADAQVSEIEYLPEPPATVEVGPSTAAPSADQTWLPGSWVWQENRYAWRPGFWSAVQPNWLWTPAHYVYTPRGYVFVDGYWDYPVARRGMLFAPVYFSSRTYAQRGFSYSPRTVINLGAFVDHLFMRPRYQHYYFGDYYAANYHDAGYFPSYSVNSSRYGYNPIFAHERWRNRQDSAWEQRVAATYQHRQDHAEARPPRIWTSQGASGVGGVASAVRNLMGTSLDQASRSRDSSWRFQAVDQAERERISQHGREIQRFRDQRQQWETEAATAATDPDRRGKPARVKLPTSPIAAKPTVRPDRDYTPPKTQEAPPLDTLVRPQPRPGRSPGATADDTRRSDRRSTRRSPKRNGRGRPELSRSRSPKWSARGASGTSRSRSPKWSGRRNPGSSRSRSPKWSGRRNPGSNRSRSPKWSGRRKPRIQTAAAAQSGAAGGTPDPTAAAAQSGAAGGTPDPTAAAAQSGAAGGTPDPTAAAAQSGAAGGTPDPTAAAAQSGTAGGTSRPVAAVAAQSGTAGPAVTGPKTDGATRIGSEAGRRQKPGQGEKQRQRLSRAREVAADTATPGTWPQATSCERQGDGFRPLPDLPLTRTLDSASEFVSINQGRDESCELFWLLLCC